MNIEDITALANKSPIKEKRKRLKPQKGFVSEYKAGFESVTSPSLVRHESVTTKTKKGKESVTSPSLVRHESVTTEPKKGKESVTSPSLESVTSPSLEKLTPVSISTLSLASEKILFSIVRICQSVASTTTPKISNSELLKTVNLKNGTVKNTILALKKAKLLNVINASFGPSGYRVFKVPIDIYREVLSSGAYHYFGIGITESVTSPSLESVTSPSLFHPNNNNINNNLLDLDNLSKRLWDTTRLPDFYLDFEFPKDGMKFSHAKFEELKRKWIIKAAEKPEMYTPENLQNSIEYLAFDLQFKKDFWVDRLGGLFSALKQPYDKPKDFLTLEEKKKAMLEWQDEQLNEENKSKVWFQISESEKEEIERTARLALIKLSKDGSLPMQDDVLNLAKELAVDKHFKNC